MNGNLVFVFLDLVYFTRHNDLQLDPFPLKCHTLIVFLAA